MTQILTDEEIAARIERARQGGGGEAPTPGGDPSASTAPAHSRLKPLSQVADDLVSYYRNIDGRFTLGIRPVDEMTRGFGAGELAFITGRPFSGKSQVMLNAIKNNRDKVIVLFTPDEVDELVLMKLTALLYTCPTQEIEERIAAGDPEWVDIVKAAASDFPNLFIIDEVMGFGPMQDVIADVRELTGRVDAVFIDYLELVPLRGRGGNDWSDIKAKCEELKRWTKDMDLPVIALRQNSRGSGDRGQAAGMGGMQFGGEDVATFVLEVFRKKQSYKYANVPEYQNSVTVNVAKNKRPPCVTGEVDLVMDERNGIITPRGG